MKTDEWIQATGCDSSACVHVMEAVHWVKSSESEDSACVQAAWTKSSESMLNDDCVEAAHPTEEEIWVRDSKDPDGPILKFTRKEWRAFIGGVRLGEFDV